MKNFELRDQTLNVNFELPAFSFIEIAISD